MSGRTDQPPPPPDGGWVEAAGVWYTGPEPNAWTSHNDARLAERAGQPTPAPIIGRVIGGWRGLIVVRPRRGDGVVIARCWTHLPKAPADS